MPGRGPQTFKKRQKEQQRKERQEEKMAKRLARSKGERPLTEDSGEPDSTAAESGTSAGTDGEQTDAGGFAA